ncbi:MAG: hypothetical protein Q4A71_00645 [Actinomycetaceae bacterium]|nr:hypothetical protein [Actinomycetaceae bacterium]
MTALKERLKTPQTAPYPGAHLGLTWRAARPSDEQLVYDFIAACENSEGAIRNTSRAQISAMVTPSRAVDALLGFTPGGELATFAAVEVEEGNEDVARAGIFASVDPTWRGLGIGRAVLLWQDARARQLLTAVYGADAQIPASIYNIVESRQVDRRRMYIAGGFSAKAELVALTRDLSAPLSRIYYEGGHTVSAASLQYDALERLVKTGTSSKAATKAQVVRWLRQLYYEMDHDLSKVMVADGPIAAILAVRPQTPFIEDADVHCRIVAADTNARSAVVGALMGEIGTVAAASGVRSLSLEVESEADWVIDPLVQMHGFIEVGRRKLYAIEF